MSSTTLSEANLRPTETVKSKNFSIGKHDVVGLIFGLIVISPALLALSFPSLVVTVREVCGGAYGAGLANVAIVFIIFLIAAVCVTMAMPKDGAK